MFSILNQGSSVYILDKSDGIKLYIGEIQSISAPKGFGIGQVIDMKINVNGQTKEYNQIPSQNSIVSYNNGNLIISENKSGLQNEVESIMTNSQQILNNIDRYKDNIKQCEQILKQLNPQFAKDKERDERLDNLENKFSGVENKIDKLINYITEKKL